MMLLQGFNTSDIQWNDLMSPSAFAGALGNAQTLPVVMDLIAHTLFHSSQITKAEFKAMKLRVSEHVRNLR